MSSFQNKNLFTSYIHLNASFSDSIGIWNGKGAAILFFSSLKDEYYRKEIAFNFLDETLSQISINTPSGYGNGLAGLGALVEQLAKENIVNQNTGDILAELDCQVLAAINVGIGQNIFLESGEAGYGMYLIQRLTSLYPESQPKQAIYRQMLDVIVARILSVLELSGTDFSEFSIWKGLPGVSLFLNTLNEIDSVVPAQNCISLINKIYYDYLMAEEFSWDKIHIWFTICHCNLFNNDIRQDELALAMNRFYEKAQLHIKSLNIYSIPFITLLLHKIADPMSEAKLSLHKNLSTYLSDIYKNEGVNKLFPYIDREKSISLGLTNGVCGHGLCLLHSDTVDQSWMKILGIINHE